MFADLAPVDHRRMIQRLPKGGGGGPARRMLRRRKNVESVIDIVVKKELFSVRYAQMRVRSFGLVGCHAK